MSVYEKLLNVQHKLLNVKIEKTGYNGYGKFHHYKLEDLQPPILEACYEEKLLCEFSFSETEAVLKIRDVDDPGLILANRVPMPKLEKLPQQNIAQSLGSYMTYIKKYLLVNTFLISDGSDDIDSLPPQKPKTEKKSSFKTADEDTPLSDYDNPNACISAIKEYLIKHNQKITEESILRRAKQLRFNKKISIKMYKGVENALKSSD